MKVCEFCGERSILIGCVDFDTSMNIRSRPLPSCLALSNPGQVNVSPLPYLCQLPATRTLPARKQRESNTWHMGESGTGKSPREGLSAPQDRRSVAFSST